MEKIRGMNMPTLPTKKPTIKSKNPGRPGSNRVVLNILAIGIGLTPIDIYLLLSGRMPPSYNWDLEERGIG